STPDASPGGRRLTQRVLCVLALVGVVQAACATVAPPAATTPAATAQQYLDHGRALIARGEMAAAATALRAALRREPDLIEARASLDQIRSEEHTSELQSRGQLVCRLLLEKKKKKKKHKNNTRVSKH